MLLGIGLFCPAPGLLPSKMEPGVPIYRTMTRQVLGRARAGRSRFADQEEIHSAFIAVCSDWARVRQISGRAMTSRIEERGR